MLTLSTSQKKLLIALAHERTDEFGDAYRRRHALGVSSTVNSAKAKLMEDGHVELYDGRYTIADPFLHSISAWREAMPGFNDGLQKIGCFPCAGNAVSDIITESLNQIRLGGDYEKTTVVDRRRNPSFSDWGFMT